MNRVEQPPADNRGIPGNNWTVMNAAPASGRVPSAHRLIRPTTLAALAFVLIAVPLRAQEPTADEIVDLAVARAELQRDSGLDQAFEATLESITEQLDGDGEVKETERETYRQYPVEGVIFEELVAREGEPLDENDAEDEVDRREKFAKEVRERRAKGEDPEPEDENRVAFDREFVERYQFELVGEEPLDGIDCWVVTLEPKPGKLPERRRIDTALNKSTGTLWISKDDYGLALVEFEMASSVRFWGGILGTLRNTVGRLEFRRYDDATWVPKLIDIRLDIRILFSNIRRRIVREWIDYSPLPLPANLPG